MKSNYLFHNKYKKIGWMILIPSVVLGLYTVFTDFEPEFLDFESGILFGKKIFGDMKIFSSKNNLLNEILGVLIIVGSLLVAFSKEKVEDEFISKIRLESLVWGVYVNYGILIIAFLFVFDLAFVWVMLFNMFTILIFFIIRFQWKIHLLNNSSQNEK